MKKVLFIGAILVSSLFSTDFSTLSTQELNALKGTVAESERDTFKSEMQSRMKSLTPEERATYTQSSGQKKMSKDGTGSGNMNKGSKGFGNR